MRNGYTSKLVNGRQHSSKIGGKLNKKKRHDPTSAESCIEESKPQSRNSSA